MSGKTKWSRRWAVKHGRTIFTNTICVSKRMAIKNYVDCCDSGWTWKKLYASGARAIKVDFALREVKP